MRNLLIITFIFSSCFTFAQTKPIKGFLFLSVDFGSKRKQSFFLPFEIDTTLTFEENIKMVKSDTLLQISNEGEFVLDSYTRIENEMDNKHLLILPAQVIFGKWSIEARAPFLRSFVEYPIKIFNQIIVSGYNEKKSYYIKHLKMLKI